MQIFGGAIAFAGRAAIDEIDNSDSTNIMVFAIKVPLG